MSIRLIAAVAENRRFTPSEKLVLMCLGDHADENGLSWPSVGRIGDWTGLDRKTVFIILKRMEVMGCLSREKRHGVINKYHLSMQAIQAYTSTESGTTLATNKPIDAQGSTESGTTLATNKPIDAQGSTESGTTPNVNTPIQAQTSAETGTTSDVNKHTSPTSTEIGTSTKNGTTTSTESGTTLKEKGKIPLTIPLREKENEPSLEPVLKKDTTNVVSKEKSQPRRITEVTEEFIEKMVNKYSDVWTADEVQDVIRASQNHPNYRKGPDRQAYVNLWLLRDAKSIRERRANNGKGSPRTNAGATREEYEPTAAIYN